MKIKRISINNFRGLDRISLDRTADVNVIAGPNAAGKSTLLEAIRLIKTILSPRYFGEAQPALMQVGLLHPHLQAIGSQNYDFSAIANRPNFRTTLTMSLALSDEEISALRMSLDQLALVQLQGEINGPVDQLSFTQYLSSQTGKDRLQAIKSAAEAEIVALNESKTLNLELTFNPQKNQISGSNIFHQSVLSILDRRLPPDKTLISFFPADRAFPQGETQIQVGSADAQAQLQAHMSSPATKYARLKQTIVQSVMLSSEGRAKLESEFNLIFDNLLPGKKLEGVSFNSLGLLKVLVKEEATGRVFDIDQMSSGEKGLVLTFIFIRLTLEKGGIILLDEPELHLNAAVQAKIMPFLLEHCIKPLSLQAFVCTHSPEIVRDAFHSSSSNLFHIRSSNDLTPILRQDMEPLVEIFSRLGSSTADLLSTRGNVYVEGEHDSELLQTGFADLLTGYQVQGLGGRSEIEKEVPNLQQEERSSRLKKLQLFILDNDRKPTSLQSTTLVRVRQLKRYCIENHLLNDNVMYDVLHQNACKNIVSRGLFPAKLEELAFNQIPEVALRRAYSLLEPGNAGLRGKDIFPDDVSKTIEILAQRIYDISAQVRSFDRVNWSASFRSDYDKVEEELRQDWRAGWKEKCSGKKVIDSLYQEYQPRMSKLDFKKEVMRRLANSKEEEWSVLRDLLNTELK